MVEYKLRDPDYMGFWNTFDNFRSSTFMAYFGNRISDGKWLIERGRMIDNVGVMEFKTGHGLDGKLQFEGVYVPEFSRGYSRKITCDFSVEGDFIKGTWQDRKSAGEFAATRFGSTFVCGNPSMQLLFTKEYNRLYTKLRELTEEFPSSPPVPGALREISKS